MWPGYRNSPAALGSRSFVSLSDDPLSALVETGIRRSHIGRREDNRMVRCLFRRRFPGNEDRERGGQSEDELGHVNLLG